MSVRHLRAGFPVLENCFHVLLCRTLLRDNAVDSDAPSEEVLGAHWPRTDAVESYKLDWKYVSVVDTCSSVSNGAAAVRTEIRCELSTTQFATNGKDVRHSGGLDVSECKLYFETNASKQDSKFRNN